MSKLIELGFIESKPNFFYKTIGNILLFVDFRTGKRKTWAVEKDTNIKVDHHILEDYKKIKALEQKPL
jgi:hypothetical protein